MERTPSGSGRRAVFSGFNESSCRVGLDGTICSLANMTLMAVNLPGRQRPSFSSQRRMNSATDCRQVSAHQSNSAGDRWHIATAPASNPGAVLQQVQRRASGPATCGRLLNFIGVDGGRQAAPDFRGADDKRAAGDAQFPGIVETNVIPVGDRHRHAGVVGSQVDAQTHLALLRSSISVCLELATSRFISRVKVGSAAMKVWVIFSSLNRGRAANPSPPEFCLIWSKR